MVFCYQNCSGVLWEKNVLVIEKKIWNSKLKDENLQKCLRSSEQFIQTVKGQNNFGNRMLFWPVLGGFTYLKGLEQLEFQLEKNIGI